MINPVHGELREKILCGAIIPPNKSVPAVRAHLTMSIQKALGENFTIVASKTGKSGRPTSINSVKLDAKKFKELCRHITQLGKIIHESTESEGDLIAQFRTMNSAEGLNSKVAKLLLKEPEKFIACARAARSYFLDGRKGGSREGDNLDLKREKIGGGVTLDTNKVQCVVGKELMQERIAIATEILKYLEKYQGSLALYGATTRVQIPGASIVSGSLAELGFHSTGELVHELAEYKRVVDSSFADRLNLDQIVCEHGEPSDVVKALQEAFVVRGLKVQDGKGEFVYDPFYLLGAAVRNIFKPKEPGQETTEASRSPVAAHLLVHDLAEFKNAITYLTALTETCRE